MHVRRPVIHVRRYAILYDIDRWRRFRLPLLVLATGCFAGFILASSLQQGKNGGTATTPLTFAAAAFYGFAFNFWLRQRYSYLAVEGDSLVVRRPGVTQRLPLADLRRARIAKVSATANRPERRKQLPRPATRWLDVEALTVRLDSGAMDLVKLRRLLGRQCLFESDLVVPVVDPEGLLREIEEATPRPEPPPRPPRRRRRR